MSQAAIPEYIHQWLLNYRLGNLSPAWIQLKKGTAWVQLIGGQWADYFNNEPILNTDISIYCDVLQGMVPIQESFELPHMQLMDNQYTNIIALTDETCDWLLFLDATQSTLELQQYQQVANELNLLKDQLDRTLSRHVGQEVTQLTMDGKIKLNSNGERKEISTLFVDIRGFTHYNEKVDAQEVMNTLNAYMHEMLQSILDNHGIIDKIMGDGVMAIFGIANSQNNHVEDAFQAGLSIQQRIQTLNTQRAKTKRKYSVLGLVLQQVKPCLAS
ncbi:MAG: adenylate/guanylate cyclase domain-containing protein [Ghiorsea sp.]|nr:adenylate/guanylate cyclase domain-containing protein [Ghiorsea sp.]